MHRICYTNAPFKNRFSTKTQNKTIHWHDLNQRFTYERKDSRMYMQSQRTVHAQFNCEFQIFLGMSSKLYNLLLLRLKLLQFVIWGAEFGNTLLQIILQFSGLTFLVVQICGNFKTICYLFESEKFLNFQLLNLIYSLNQYESKGMYQVFLI